MEQGPLACYKEGAGDARLGVNPNLAPPGRKEVAMRPPRALAAVAAAERGPSGAG